MQPTHKLNELVADVEELLAELGDDNDTEVKELCQRVEQALGAAKRAAKRAAAGEGPGPLARVRDFAGGVDTYINDYPRLAFVTALLVAGTVGYLAGITARIRD